jgi:hypothetical protein
MFETHFRLQNFCEAVRRNSQSWDDDRRHSISEDYDKYELTYLETNTFLSCRTALRSRH